MGKMESEVAAIRRAARVADEGYRLFMNAALRPAGLRTDR
jgi:Xaa-Pro aminopeptidase